MWGIFGKNLEVEWLEKRVVVVLLLLVELLLCRVSWRMLEDQLTRISLANQGGLISQTLTVSSFLKQNSEELMGLRKGWLRG